MQADWWAMCCQARVGRRVDYDACTAALYVEREVAGDGQRPSPTGEGMGCGWAVACPFIDRETNSMSMTCLPTSSSPYHA